MLKIQRSANGRVVFMLSGRIEADDVNELRQLLALEIAGQQLVLDLRDVTLVTRPLGQLNITIFVSPARPAILACASGCHG